jgi:transcriptional regulator GlxA family with amidase domain
LEISVRLLSGLTARLGVPANLFNGQLIPLEHFLPREEVAAFVEQLSLAQGARKIIELMKAFLSRAMMNKAIRLMLPALSLEQLLLPSSALAKSFDLSPRQLERRFLVAYGMPLRDYRRLARFSAALAQMLSQPQSTGTLARIAVKANYVDQAHLIRDFRQFVGNTPGRVMKAQQQEESIYQFWRLSRTELHSYID